jgi:hypothetical protein
VRRRRERDSGPGVSSGLMENGVISDHIIITPLIILLAFQNQAPGNEIKSTFNIAHLREL